MITGLICSLATFTIIQSVNMPPYLTVPFQNISIQEEKSFSIDLSKHYSDSDGVIVDYKIIEPSSVGVIKNGSVFTLTPSKDFYGYRHIYTMAIDDDGDTARYGFDLTINNVNDPPEFIRPIPDTALHVNEELKIDLKPILFDVDNRLEDLHIQKIGISGVSLIQRDTCIIIKAYQLSDTARITLNAVDDSGATGSASFKLYPNLPTEYNHEFRIQGDYDYNYGSIYYPQYAFHTGIDVNGDSTIGIYGLLNGALFYDNYNLKAQKVRQTLISTTIKPTTINNASAHRLNNGTYFVNYTQQSSWKYILLDSSFNQTAQYTLPGYNRSNNEITEGFGSIIVYGRPLSLSNGKGLVVDFFDYNLNLIRTDTVCTDGNPAPMQIFIDKNSYTVFWTDSVCKARKFTQQGKPLYAQDMVIPYINRNVNRPINFDIISKVTSLTDGGYLVVWSFDDAVSIGDGSYSSTMVPKLYGILIDQSLQPISQPKILNTDTAGIRNVDVEYTSQFNGNILVAWRNCGGNGDPIYRCHMFYDKNLKPVTDMFDDNIHFTQYRRINDTILCKIENRNDGILWGEFITPPFNNFTTTISLPYIQKNAFARQENLNNSSYITAYDLAGRKIPTKDLVNRYAVNGFLIKCSTSKNIRKPSVTIK